MKNDKRVNAGNKDLVKYIEIFIGPLTLRKVGKTKLRHGNQKQYLILSWGNSNLFFVWAGRYYEVRLTKENAPLLKENTLYIGQNRSRLSSVARLALTTVSRYLYQTREATYVEYEFEDEIMTVVRDV
jgi:hypothetical protein